MLTLCGAPTGGPGQQEPVLRDIRRSSPPAPHCSLLGWEVGVRILRLDMVVCRLAGTVTAVSVAQQ
jgi:hypothetical protein